MNRDYDIVFAIEFPVDLKCDVPFLAISSRYRSYPIGACVRSALIPLKPGLELIHGQHCSNGLADFRSVGGGH
jgi:hypothetical protein